MTVKSVVELGFLERFLGTAIEHPDLPALRLLDDPPEGRSSWTYGEFLELIERYRWAFEHLGVQPGDAVALVLPTGVDLAACVYALPSLGAIFTPIHPKLTAREMRLVLEDLGPAGIVSTAAVAEAHADILLAGQGSPRFLLSVDDAPAGKLRVEALGALPPGSSSLVAPDGNPLVSCHYTYKGLGYPLGVAHRYRSYASCVAGMERNFPDAKRGVHLASLPFHSIYGLTAEILAPLSGENEVLITERVLDILDALERYRATLACVVPIVLRRMISSARARAEAGRPVQLNPRLRIASGGSYMDAALAAEAEEVLRVEVHQGYGLTETLPVAGTRPRKNKHGSLGLPFSKEIETTVVDSDGREVDAGVAGQIVVRGPTLLDSFWKRPAETERFLRNGWFQTGDLGFKDEDGFLFFLGRSGGVTKVAALMVDLAEVEAVLAEHPAVAQARVTVGQREELGEWLTAWVLLRQAAEASENHLRLHCRQALSTHKIPREFRICTRS